MAISATLQEDFLADQASTCSVGKSECKAVAPSTTKRLTFQTQEKRVSDEKPRLPKITKD
jgi:hypothetical protein